MTIVMKFGGTSMAGAERISRAAELARTSAGDHAVVVVVSAMDGVTELLLELADAAGAANRAAVLTLLGTVRTQHESAARGVGGSAPAAVEGLLNRLETLAGGILAVGECTPRSRDAVVAFGERLSTAMMAAAMNATALDGHEAGIVTDDHFGEADPLMELSMHQVRERLGPLVQQRRPVVVSGFIAGTQHGVTSTLGRGGSDYTATILGAALSAHEIWIWSDVDGLMTADPRAVPDARLLSHISFAEAVEMGKFGAKSMHPRALEPAAAHGVPVRMKNTFKPLGAGTHIGGHDGREDHAHAGGPVRAVPVLKGMAMLTIGGGGMVGRPGTAAAIFDALGAARVNVHMICQSVSEAAISVVVAQGQLDKARAALGRVASATSGGAKLEAIDQIAIVAAVGGQMRGTPGIAARVFTAVARKQINVIAIAQGSSELSICFAVQASAAGEAVAALHGEFNLASAG